ncbi:MAG: SDR family oxidoreductase [Chloroflexota bacterium]
MKAKLRNQIALVTGSTQGLGRAIALKFAENGADIVVNSMFPEEAPPILKELGGSGVKAVFEEADITDYQSVKHMVTRAVNRMGRIDILVASGGATGGMLMPRYFHETDPDSYVDVAKSQWFSRLYCVRAVLDHMIARQRGKIIMITTDAGRWPTPGESVIGGAGAAIVMATKVLAAEFARWQIRVNTISTTVIRNTPGGQIALDNPAAKVFEKALKRQPFPVGTGDIAEAALFLASQDSDQITGQVLSVNGGLCFPG